MSVALYYKEFKLGILTYENNKFIYNSSIEESLALKKYVGLIDYNLTNSTNLKSDKLFRFFKINFIDIATKREDILEKFETKPKNDYEFLINLCKLSLDKFNFWIAEN